MEKEQYEIMRRLEDRLWWYAGMRCIVASLLRSSASPDAAGDVIAGAAGLRMLDAGCGTGANLDAFSRFGTVMGTDISETALSHCRQRGHRHISRGSVEQLPFAGESFDLVSCFDVIYHQAVPDDLSALREFHRVLKGGGHLIVRVPAYDWLRGMHDAAVHTRHRYTARELRAKLEAAGFRVNRVTHANLFLLPAAILKRLAEGRGIATKSDLSEPGPLANRLFASILGVEARIVRHADLPWGLSVIGLGVKGCK